MVMQLASPSQNKWLLIRKGVVLTPIISPVIVALDDYFGKAHCRSYVTSGKRQPEDQIRIILDAGWSHGIQKEFPQLQGATAATMTMFDSQAVPLWYVVWGRLLTIGFLVNPPEASKVPFDYVHANSGKKITHGTLIQPSAHFAGTAFDIGGSGGMDPRIDDELACVEAAVGKIPGLVNLVAERDNNCVHVNCKEVKE